MQVIH